MNATLSGYLTKAVDMLPTDENAERKKMLKCAGEIGSLNWGEESRLEAEQRIEELKDRVAISDKNTEKQLAEQKKELVAQ